jgi:hypothetical protein
MRAMSLEVATGDEERRAPAKGPAGPLPAAGRYRVTCYLLREG